MMALSTYLISLFLGISYAFPNGPPVNSKSDLCKTMFPGHKVAAQQDDSPFKIKPSQKCFALGQEVSVEISTSMGAINGLFIQARTGTFSTAVTSFGTFRSRAPDTGSYRCFNRDKSAFGHKGTSPGVESMKVIWKAPESGLFSDILIGGTLLLEKEKFWLNEFTAVKYNKSCVQQSIDDSASTSLGYSHTLLVFLSMMWMSTLSI